jgi:hypothetical protein
MTQDPMTPSLRSSPYRLPAGLATGDHRLDARLQELQAGLVGDAAVRCPTLQEARDFLLDARDRELAAGRSPAEAADEALAALGDVREIVEEQRTRQRGIFWRTTLTTGLFFGFFMFLFIIADQQLRSNHSTFLSILVLAVVSLMSGVLFGGVMGHHAAYRAVSTESLESDGGDAGAFRVVPGRMGRRDVSLQSFVFALLLPLPAAGLLERGPMGDVAPWMLAVLCLMSIFGIIGVIRLRRFGAVVTPDEAVVDSWRGPVRIPRDAVRAMCDNGLLTRLASGSAANSIRVEWQDGDGRTRRNRMNLPIDLVNGDRLRAWFADAAEANAAARPPCDDAARPARPR